MADTKCIMCLYKLFSCYSFQRYIREEINTYSKWEIARENNIIIGSSWIKTEEAR